MGVQASYPRTDGERRVERDCNNLSSVISVLLSSGVWSIHDIGSLLNLIDKIGWDNLPPELRRLLWNYLYGFRNATAIDSSIDEQYSESEIKIYRQFEHTVDKIHSEESQESVNNLNDPEELFSAASNVQMTLQSNPSSQNDSYSDENETEELKEEEGSVISQTTDASENDSDVIQERDLEGKSSANDGLNKDSLNIDTLTVKEIPSFRSGEFNDWFNKRTPEELEKLYTNKGFKNKISDGLRGTGGKHEFLMVVEAPQWSKWGVKAQQVQEDFAIPISSLNEGGLAKGWKHSTGIKGSKSPGSKTAHNELQAGIQKSSSIDEFKVFMRDWSDKWIEGGYNALPSGFH